MLRAKEAQEKRDTAARGNGTPQYSGYSTADTIATSTDEDSDDLLLTTDEEEEESAEAATL